MTRNKYCIAWMHTVTPVLIFWILKTTKISLSMCWVATKLTSKEISKNAKQFHWHSIYNIQRIIYGCISYDSNIVWGYDCSILQLSKWIKIDMMTMRSLLKIDISIFLFSLKLAILYFITKAAVSRWKLLAETCVQQCCKTCFSRRCTT